MVVATTRRSTILLTAVSCAAPAAALALQDYAEVLQSVPVYQQVQVAVPQQQCQQQQVVNGNGYNQNVTAGTVLGGVAGGVIGNQVGSGSGKALATVAGTVIGAVTGGEVAAATAPRPTATTVQQCATVMTYQVQNRIDGYDVTYRYLGQVFQTRLQQDPGPRLPVQVDVRPAVN